MRSLWPGEGGACSQWSPRTLCLVGALEDLWDDPWESWMAWDGEDE